MDYVSEADKGAETERGNLPQGSTAGASRFGCHDHYEKNRNRTMAAGGEE
jgi:hypothetical protein